MLTRLCFGHSPELPHAPTPHVPVPRAVCTSLFESDFAGQDGSVQAFVARFADPVSAGGDTAWIPAARISIKYYSWDLNDARRR